MIQTIDSPPSAAPVSETFQSSAAETVSRSVPLCVRLDVALSPVAS